MPAAKARLWALAGALSAGCSLVMEELPPAPEEPAPGGASGNGGFTGASGGAAGASDGAGSSAGGAASAAGAGDGGDECLSECDCDGDGVAAEGPCRGQDCDDLDPDAWPGQPDFFFEERESGGHDYDCSGEIELERPVIDCAELPCDAVNQGFVVENPQCGTNQDWGRCDEAAPLMCTPQTLSSEPVRCH